MSNEEYSVVWLENEKMYRAGASTFPGSYSLGSDPIEAITRLRKMLSTFISVGHVVTTQEEANRLPNDTVLLYRSSHGPIVTQKEFHAGNAPVFLVAGSDDRFQNIHLPATIIYLPQTHDEAVTR